MGAGAADGSLDAVLDNGSAWTRRGHGRAAHDGAQPQVPERELVHLVLHARRGLAARGHPMLNPAAVAPLPPTSTHV